jgi:hypothetical protein
MSPLVPGVHRLFASDGGPSILSVKTQEGLIAVTPIGTTISVAAEAIAFTFLYGPGRCNCGFPR